jgi:phosphoserine phosphatase RsbU/P
MRSRKTTIFKQLIFNIAIPTLLALLVFTVMNFQRTRSILTSGTDEKNELLSNEVTKILKFQDIAFNLIEDELTVRLRKISNLLVDKYFVNTDNIDKLDLREIANKIGLDSAREDIYIIRRDGIIINTTSKQDYGFNLFGQGDTMRINLLRFFKSGDFVNELFSIPAKTPRPRKYTYQATKDKKYLVELGIYSEKADTIVQIMEELKNDLRTESEGILDVELYLKADKPFTMNKDAIEVDGHYEILLAAFQNKDTTSFIKRYGDSWYQYQYIYMERSASNLYKGSVIRIISDVTAQKALFRKEAIRFTLIFGITMLILAFLIYRKVRVITLPIIKLVENVNRITNGNLRERAEVTGNNEITRLSEKFNMMIAQLESYYYELEEKVKDRTIKIEKQKAEIEEQKKHIMDSIYYARRIQNAILPSLSLIESHFKNYFIFYLPKDIVSGDFYWMNEIDGKFMVAAVDCTGHGVPGAFMSIVGFNQLNHVVNVRKARSASLILDELNKGVITTLNENTSENSLKDGMDMALCVFDFKKKKIEFAGANNPLLLIRNKKAILYKGDRFPIGAFEGNETQLFRNNVIDLIEGDFIYLFSDGYADQFGGPQDKKFLFRKFQELLLEIHTQPVETQKEILRIRLYEWMENRDQVDDILVIGIKV